MAASGGEGLAQDDYYYEIQLTNKQLVFYFMAGATGLILSFLAGVMVGRGVDSAEAGGPPRAPVQDERLALVEETPRPEATPDLQYARRLEGERRDETLATPAAATPAPVAATPAPVASPTPRPVATSRPLVTPRPPVATPRPGATPRVTRTPRPAPSPRATPRPTSTARPTAPAVAAGTFSLQVGAFKDRKAADAVVAQLEAKGFPAYVVTPDGAPGGLFNVRVGTYAARADAESVQARLRDRKFQPFIVRN